MKKKIYGFIFIFLLSGRLLHSTVPLSQEAINKKAVAIKQMMIRHNYMVAGLVTLGYLHQFTVLLTGLEYFFPSEVCEHKIKEPEPKKEEIGFFAGIAKNTKELFCTKKGWESIGLTTFSLVGQIGAFCLFQKIADTIYHPDTLHWYLRTHVPYEKTIAVIENVLQKFDSDQIIDDKQRVYYKAVLYRSCVQLRHYAGDICAYMVYKAKQLPDNQKQLAEHTQQHLLQYQQNIFKQLFTVLQQESFNGEKIVALLRAYVIELRYQRTIFASVEGESDLEMREEDFYD